jgi:hypothetical protein
VGNAGIHSLNMWCGLTICSIACSPYSEMNID